MKNKKIYCLYVLIFPNRKMYFGITSKNPKKRWQNGTGYSKDKQPVIYSAIQKYGWENIEQNIIFNNLSFKVANILEEIYIESFKTNCKKYGNEFGYNMTDGGDGTSGHVVSKESKEKMSKAKLGKYTGKKCYRSKLVICDDIEYESATDFAKKHGLSVSRVGTWLRGQKAMPKEWFDKKLCYKGQFDIIKVQKKPHFRPVYFGDETFSSSAKLARRLNKSPATICNWLKGKTEPPFEIKEKGIGYLK